MMLINLLKTLQITPKIAFRLYSQEFTPKALRSLKAKSTRNTVQFYVDSFRVRTVGGNGGNGCISFLSAWCKEHAGPDGGDGGHGGHVIFQATHTVKSLNHVKSVTQALHGGRGDNKDRHGKNAGHVVVPVPLETNSTRDSESENPKIPHSKEKEKVHRKVKMPRYEVVVDKPRTIVRDAFGTVVGDLSEEGTLFVAARGGSGGRGNRFFMTDTAQAPDIAELGATGETNVYTLEVRSIAHIGLLGFPNAGKSTLLRALTRARPTVAPYPFTTLHPHIGMVPYDDYEQVAIADLPGLIPGSHKNYGLGIQFLQHVERCRGLIYLLDATEAPLEQLEHLTHELAQYSTELAQRPSCIVLNKIDLPAGRAAFESVSKEKQVLGISAKTGLGLQRLLAAVRKIYDSGS